MKHLHDTLIESRKNKNKTIKSLLVINPQEPLGTVLTQEEIQEIIEFANKNNLVLIVSEKLQNSVYNTSSSSSSNNFVSFRKVAKDINSPVEIISFTSVSRGPFF